MQPNETASVQYTFTSHAAVLKLHDDDRSSLLLLTSPSPGVSLFNISCDLWNVNTLLLFLLRYLDFARDDRVKRRTPPVQPAK